MSSERGRILLSIARGAISEAFGIPYTDDEDAEWLSEPGASFVTLTQHGHLRGCIGSLSAWRPLINDVRHNAFAAAFRDPRFEPLRVNELAYTVIEVSLLTQDTAMSFIDENDALSQLRPGIDGVILEYGSHRATFLPQVWESMSTPRHFIAELKRKAGLPPDFWSNDIRLSRYAVEKYSEADSPPSETI